MASFFYHPISHTRTFILLKKNPKKYVFSATKYEHPIQRAFSIHKNKTKLYKKYYPEDFI